MRTRMLKQTKRKLFGIRNGAFTEMRTLGSALGLAIYRTEEDIVAAIQDRLEG